MKCPKCGYLGFETGDRCKNCGYDFSLIADAAASARPEPDFAIRTRDTETAAPELWLDRLDRSMSDGTPPVDASLPLFNPGRPDEAPLVALPVAPRAPLAVRRTPDTPRLRAVPRVARMPGPALNFRADLEDEAPEATPAPAPVSRRARPAVEGTREIGGRRLAAALIDHAILMAIDLTVIYFTVRMAGLAAADVLLLPPAPLAIFLGLLKLAYFTAFTAVGGQTIGKMAMGIRVVAEHGTIDSARAIRRTLAGLLSVLPLGLGFVPAFVGADRRTLHDRLTQTRVVGLPSA